MLLLWCADFFQNELFQKKKKTFRNTIRVSKGLDPDPDRCSVSPDLGPNCLQRLSTDNKSGCYQERAVFYDALPFCKL